MRQALDASGAGSFQDRGSWSTTYCRPHNALEHARPSRLATPRRTITYIIATHRCVRRNNEMRVVRGNHSMRYARSTPWHAGPRAVRCSQRIGACVARKFSQGFWSGTSVNPWCAGPGIVRQSLTTRSSSRAGYCGLATLALCHPLAAERDGDMTGLMSSGTFMRTCGVVGVW